MFMQILQCMDVPLVTLCLFFRHEFASRWRWGGGTVDARKYLVSVSTFFSEAIAFIGLNREKRDCQGPTPMEAVGGRHFVGSSWENQLPQLALLLDETAF